MNSDSGSLSIAPERVLDTASNDRTSSVAHCMDVATETTCAYPPATHTCDDDVLEAVVLCDDDVNGDDTVLGELARVAATNTQLQDHTLGHVRTVDQLLPVARSSWP